MAAYIIADVTVTNPKQFAEYHNLSGAAFDSMDAARKFYESDEYRKSREGAAIMNMLIVEGV